VSHCVVFRIRGRIERIAVVLLAVHSALLACSAFMHSPTLNEPAHLAAGISNWQFARFDVYCVNPPLVRMLASVPVLLSGMETDWRAYHEGPGARPEFSLGEAFVEANGEQATKLFVLARWVCIPFSLLGGWICYCWGRELCEDDNPSTSPFATGERKLAGLLALTLWCFCPNVLAHGALITPDIGATALALAACYAFWRWLKEPTWWWTFCSGLVLGVSQLTKLTLVILYPLSILLWVVYRWVKQRECSGCTSLDEAKKRFPHTLPEDGEKKTLLSSLGARQSWWLHELAMLFVRAVIAVYIVNLGYFFEGSLTRLGDFRFVSAALRAEPDHDKPRPGTGNRFADSWLGGLRVPLPKTYVLGIDLQMRDFESYGRPSYLRGEFRETGWWYYYLYALAVKVPLGTSALVILAATAGALRKTLAPPLCAGRCISWRDEFTLLAPAMVILALVSSQTGFSEHMRYVLPCFPFVFVWIGRVAFVFTREWWHSGPSMRKERDMAKRSTAMGRRAVTGMAAAALIWSIGSSLWVYPHSLSYFNELVGGPMGGPKHLINSNLDWGQDLLFLKDWLHDHSEAGPSQPRRAPISLIYFGYFNPRHAGIEYTVPDALVERQDGPVPVEVIPPGWYAVSVNFVRGYPWFVYKPDGTKAGVSQNALAAFQRLKPVAIAGYSIYIYKVELP